MSDALRAAQILWELVGSTAPAEARHPAVYQRVVDCDQDQLWALIGRLLSAFEQLGSERPDVVLPFLGRLLNEAEAHP